MKIKSKRFYISFSWQELTNKFVNYLKESCYRNFFDIKQGKDLVIEINDLDGNILLKLKEFLEQFNQKHNLDVFDSGILFSENELRETDAIMSRLKYL